MSTDKQDYLHQPVLLKEVLKWLGPAEDVLQLNERRAQPSSSEPCLIVDATTGEGGHAEAFLKNFPQTILLCVDADSTQLEVAQKRLAAYKGRVRFFHSSYASFFKNYQSFAINKPDRIFFDLGISSRHYAEGKRGFSFQKDEVLDMRLNSNKGPTAAQLLNSLSEEELASLIALYGEERYARRIARAVCKARQGKELSRTSELVKIITKAVGAYYHRQRIHPATRTFQALRIAVNNELNELREGLDYGFEVLKKGGRLGVISFHSLEDRIVKQFFKAKNKPCKCPPEMPICQCGAQKQILIITKKPITALPVEIKLNPRARSAKFRVGEKCA